MPTREDPIECPQCGGTRFHKKDGHCLRCEYEDARTDYHMGLRDDHPADFGFASEGSALRAATSGECQCGQEIDDDDAFCRNCGTRLNPRRHPCPNCKRPARLTDEDKRRGYQCDACADAVERGIDLYY